MKVKLTDAKGQKPVRVIVRVAPEDLQHIKGVAGDTPVAVFIRRCVAEKMAKVAA